MENGKNHEVELRGLLSEKQHDALRTDLISKGYSYSEDDKVSYFFVWDKGVFKLNDEVSQNRSKISLKIGDEVKGSLREYEVVFDRESLEGMLHIFSELGFRKFHKVDQKRKNFILNDLDVEIALKYTPDFQHHFEIEYIGDQFEEIDEIKAYLRGVCEKFGIIPLDEWELDKRIKEIKARYGLKE